MRPNPVVKRGVLLNGFVKEMKERSRWSASARLVLPASHAAEQLVETEAIKDEVPELCSRVAVLLTQKVGKLVITDASKGKILDERLVKEGSPT